MQCIRPIRSRTSLRSKLQILHEAFDFGIGLRRIQLERAGVKYNEAFPAGSNSGVNVSGIKNRLREIRRRFPAI